VTTPCESGSIRFYKNLHMRGDCLSTRKSHKTSHFVGVWVAVISSVFVHSAHMRASSSRAATSQPQGLSYQLLSTVNAKRACPGMLTGIRLCDR
jgi:hypothetical protein